MRVIMVKLDKKVCLSNCQSKILSVPLFCNTALLENYYSSVF